MNRPSNQQKNFNPFGLPAFWRARLARLSD